jgi:UDP-N-acetylmuramoyl-tripeptide--D-alanyl-D-alanine ligase
MRFRVTELADALGGQVIGPDITVDGLAIDSRLLRPGALFAAVRGERDGHDFVEAAGRSGAAAVLVERMDPEAVGSMSAVQVASVDDALGALARLARSRLPDRVVGITGSVGKTTTKDLLASVLAQRFRTAASEKSFNNELGVPLTLANAPDDTEAAVIEMGARGHGHISLLCELARPTVGVVTLVAAVHSEFMGGLDRIMEAKRELIESLPSSGVAVLNADDPRVAAMASSTSARVLSFGSGGDVRAEQVRLDDDLHPSFELVVAGERLEVRLGVRGEHNVTNALAAAAAAVALGVPLDAIAAGLAAPVLSPWRMELHRAPSGAVVLNDAYNANPTSMAAALRSLAALDGERRVAVVGYMAELGSDERSEHEQVARLAASLGVDVIAVGTDLYGVDPVPDVDAALAALGPIGSGDVVLVKASRMAGLERVAAALVEA